MRPAWLPLHWILADSPQENVTITATEPITHGLSGELVAPDWPPLTLDEADRVMRHFPAAGTATSLLTISPRPFSAASVVATPREPVFLKRHALAVRTPQSLAEEHAFLAHLAANTPLVRPAFTTASGVSAVVQGPWCYELHPVAPGIDAYRDALSWTPFFSSGHAHAAGRAMAQLHNAAEGYAAPARGRAQLVTSFTILPAPNPYKAIEHYLAARPRLQAWLGPRHWRAAVEETLSPSFQTIAETPFAAWFAGRGSHPMSRHFAPLWTHNDLHASNLTWTSAGPDAKVAAVIDFGLADRTCALHDLATAIERNIVEWLRLDEPAATRGPLTHPDQLDALIAGYHEIRPLDPAALTTLAAILPIVHLEFALSEADYFLTVLNSPEKTAIAWDGYFLDHARWFSSLEGQSLLDQIRSFRP